jgi:hypothetical protein
VRLVLYGGLVLNLVVLALLGFLLGGRGGSAGLTTASVAADALTQCRAIWLYLGKLVWPATLVLDHGEWLAAGPGDVWPFVVATTVLAVGGAIGFWRQPRLFFPFVAAAILLGPTTSVVPVRLQRRGRAWRAGCRSMASASAASFPETDSISQITRVSSATSASKLRVPAINRA